MDSTTLSRVVRAIVIEQQSIIGPLAVDQANKVESVHISSDLSKIEVSGNPEEVLSLLVGRYEKLFGRASVEACKEAIKELRSSLSPKDLPAILQ